MSETYPRWRYYPQHVAPQNWVEELVDVFSNAQGEIDSSKVQGLESDGVLKVIRPGLQSLGYLVEKGKKKTDRLARPVLFGDQGHPRATTKSTPLSKKSVSF